MSSTPRPRTPPAFLFLLLAAGAICLAVSPQSLWIDETQTALKAIQPTLHGWWHVLYAEHNSNLQLPLYMIYMWAWARVFGVSEIALRAANVPWFLVGFFAIFHFLRRRPALQSAALLLFCIHPFVWYYLDEARPYMMQLSGALLTTGAVFAALEAPEEPVPSSWWWLFASGITLLCGAGLLGVPWAIALILLVIGRKGFRESLFRSGLPAMVVFVPFLTILALYFAWTLKEKARPGETGMGLVSIPFVFYEHLGLAGLGPGRADLRTRGARIFLSYLPALCLLGVPLAYALARAMGERFGLSSRRFFAVCLAVALPAGFVFALGFAKNFLVLGRHLTPLFPFVLGGMAFAVSLLWERRRLLDRAAVLLIVIGLTLSALEVRFAYRHQKDDNKDAAALAARALASGQSVWWAADAGCAAYYGLPLSGRPEPGAATILWKPSMAQLAHQNPPTLIILSKPDLFDTRFGTRAFIQSHGYAQVETLPAFSIWKR